MTSQASAEPAASTRKPVRQELTSTTQASGVPVSSMPRPPIPSTSPETDANCAAGNWRAMNTVHTRKAGAQPMPISACPSSTSAIAGRERRQQRAGDRQRESGQHGAPHAMEVDADAHQQLQRAEAEVKDAGEQAELLRREAEVALQLGRHHGRDGAVGLAQREGGGQREQHDPCRAHGTLRGGGVCVAVHEAGFRPPARGCRAPAPRSRRSAAARRGRTSARRSSIRRRRCASMKSFRPRRTVSGEPMVAQDSTLSSRARSAGPSAARDSPGRGGGSLAGRPLRRLTKACCIEVARTCASSSVSAANTLKPSIT